PPSRSAAISTSGWWRCTAGHGCRTASCLPAPATAAAPPFTSAPTPILSTRRTTRGPFRSAVGTTPPSVITRAAGTAFTSTPWARHHRRITMAQTLLYYDPTGKIIMSEAANYPQPAGSVSYIETEIPDGYIPVSVGEGGEIITEALPL